MLRYPLVVLAAGLFALGISSAFGIAVAADYLSRDLPGATPQLIGAVFSTLGEFALAAGAAWVAYVVGLPDRPLPPPPPPPPPGGPRPR